MYDEKHDDKSASDSRQCLRVPIPGEIQPKIKLFKFQVQSIQVIILYVRYIVIQKIIRGSQRIRSYLI